MSSLRLYTLTLNKSAMTLFWGCFYNFKFSVFGKEHRPGELLIIQVSMSTSFLKALNLRKTKAMATHSSTLAWKIPWTEEPGTLQSMGALRVGHDWVSSLSLLTFIHWRRKWQPTPVFLPGESQGRGSLVGCCLWGRTESDTTEAT